MGLVFATLGPDHVLWDIGAFFSQLAVVTFGGAYAVLAYMAQEAVQGFGWLQPGEMADGLGLAETTPGPLIMVTQFVGYLAAYRAPEPFTPLVAGLLGAGLTTWGTFAPCFLWIFAFAPWIDRLGNAVLIKGGHRTGPPDDLLAMGEGPSKTMNWLQGKRIEVGPVHGTGCALASAIAAGLGLGQDLEKAVANARRFVATRLKESAALGGGAHFLAPAGGRR